MRHEKILREMDSKLENVVWKQGRSLYFHAEISFKHCIVLYYYYYGKGNREPRNYLEFGLDLRSLEVQLHHVSELCP